jgi:hypothetical protein
VPYNNNEENGNYFSPIALFFHCPNYQEIPSKHAFDTYDRDVGSEEKLW